MDVRSLLFQDAMDPTRFLRIATENPNTVECRVFFGPDKDHLTFHGTTTIAKRLFYPDGTHCRYGFNIARDPEPVKPRRDDRRHRRDDYDDDMN